MLDNKKSSDGVNIKILGTCCSNCNLLEQNTREALRQLGREDEVEKVSEIQDILSYGIMNTPALVVGKKIVVSGIVPSVEEIKKKLKNF
jgi:small redox-active disulfide protein 2